MEHFAGEHTAGLPVRDGCDAAGAADAACRDASAGVSATAGHTAATEAAEAAEAAGAARCAAAEEGHAADTPAGAAPVAEIRGVVEHGRRLGRELGFPTANLAVDEALAAEDGVYASLVEVGGVRYLAMSNLGRNPSVGGQPRHLETHLFGFEGSLYGREVRVVLLRKVRDERRFDTVEELRAQIARDKEQILNLKMNLK